MSSAEWRPFCLGLNVLKRKYILYMPYNMHMAKHAGVIYY